MAKKPRFDDLDDDLSTENVALTRAMQVFHDYWWPTPLGQRANDLYTTEKILQQFNAIFQGLCTQKELHDALLKQGYRYEYNGSGFTWLLTRAK